MKPRGGRSRDAAGHVAPGGAVDRRRQLRTRGPGSASRRWRRRAAGPGIDRRVRARKLSTVDDVARVLRRRLVEEARFEVAATDPGVLRCRIAALLTEEALPLDDSERAALVDRVVSGTIGLGPLEPLMDDPAVDEIMVNGRGAVHVERRGRIVETDVSFGSDEELMHLIERILSPLGRRVDEAAPLADARLPDGRGSTACIPPLSLDGPLLTIRRFRRRAFGFEDLVDNATVTADAASFLRERVEGRSNIVVSGAGSGKTTLLNVLSSFVERAERIITIEDAAELRLSSRVLRLESRPANVEGREVTFANWCATRSACGPTASSSARCGERRRSTCFRR